MIFNEIYSVYYNAVANIIHQILLGERDEKVLYEIAKKTAFEESPLTVIPNLKSGKWQLVKEDFSTIIKNPPQIPLTLIQKRWIKSLECDPKIQLFEPNFSGLEGIEPLFTVDDYYIYDKYLDGDNYLDEGYKARFKTILTAIKENKGVRLEVKNKNGVFISEICKPKRLEYSEKDDKFRLISSGNHFLSTINLSKIVSCEIYDGSINLNDRERTIDYAEVTLKIADERNALERCMLHFAHFEKHAEKIDEKTYLLTVKYDRCDESEMVIRVLSFGPMVEVVSPPFFKRQIIKKLKRQMQLDNNDNYHG